MRKRDVCSACSAVFALLIGVVTVAEGASAQGGPLYECPIGVPDLPEGRWVGPWTFSRLGSPQQGGTENLQEITHAAVLPPADGHEDDVRVLLWCRPSYDFEDLRPARSFLWSPARPGVVAPLPIPDSDADARTDPFCAGHTFLPNGDLMVFGGLNMYLSTMPCDHPEFDDCILKPGFSCTENVSSRQPYGHLNTYRLRTDVDPPVWLDDDDGWPKQMWRERWYPSAILLHDGRIFVSGHQGQPGPEPLDCAPVPDWTDPLDDYSTLEVREYFDDSVEDFTTIERHLQEAVDCLTEDGHEQEDYPRLHMLSNGWLMHANDHDEGYPMTPRTSFANLQFPTCDPVRWEDGDGPAINRHGGSSVHFVYRDVLQEPVDVVYAIGGIRDYGDAQCQSPPNESVDSVEKMVDPRPVGSSWETAPPLPYLGGPGVGRGSHNSVILLDGSILVVGGAQYVVGDNCYGALERTALRYYPPEVFTDITPGSPEDDWVLMDEQEYARKYHSVAGLLPDGRVFSVGGESPASAQHSLEVYEPDYYFKATRPVINSAPSTIEIADDATTYLVDAAICQFDEVERVVLIRNGSMTHAFDFNLRYVELEWLPFTGSPPDVVLQILPPESGYVAPPGWYLLVVIDSQDVPSEGRWIQVLPDQS